jgi:hypothetical protein
MRKRLAKKKHHCILGLRQAEELRLRLRLRLS